MLKRKVALALASVAVSSTQALAQSPAAPVDQLQYLPKAKPAIASYYRDILSARKSIDMTYFIWDACTTTGKVITQALEKKVKEGVKVRVLLDGTNQKPDGQKLLKAAMARRGIELRYFNKSYYDETMPMKEMRLESNWRTHAKFTLVDGEKFITGGRNIGDDYFSLREGFDFVDRDARVVGPAAKQAAERYEELWTSEHSYVPDEPSKEATDEYVKWCAEQPDKAKEVTAFLEENSEKIVAEIPAVQCKDVSFIMDNPSFRGNRYAVTNFIRSIGWNSKERLKEKRMTYAILDLMDNATSTFHMENWAYLPAWGINKRIQEMKKKRLRVYAITNDITDVEAMSATQIDYIFRDEMKGKDKALGQNMVTLSRHGSLDDSWEMTPPGDTQFMIHSKVWMSDRKNVIVGSFNLDPRSFHTNVESGVLVKDCKPFGDLVMKEMRTLIQDSRADKKDCAKCKNIPEYNWKERWMYWMKRELY